MSMQVTLRPPGLAPAAPSVMVAGRYRLEDRLGKGGMGTVYRAYDLTAGRHVALKRLSAENSERRSTRMFEREFRVLSGLRHPRIIAVYDYGLDESGAYYTMELLDGGDLRDRAPLPYTEVCLYLRDVACSLALLHSRRLVHRDLSPRNVRVTSDGRAKLLDFGALASFGKSSTVVGTPPAVPPEALYGGDLDQRADLYSLGTLAYWALTSEHAYPVKTLDELPLAWSRTLKPPSEVVASRGGLPEIPAALDELVLSLLQSNPLARPSSAVEVMAKLAVIGRLPPDEEPLWPASYLQGGKTVGRVRERAQLRKCMRSALAGHSSVAVIEAEQGMGSGRIFGEMAIEARQLGALAVVVNADEHPGAYGVATEVVQALLSARPELGRRALEPHRDMLARVLPGSEGRVSTRRMATLAERSSGDPREQRLRTLSALQSLVEAYVAEQPIVLAIRGFEHADEASASWLSGLARSTDGPLMIALSFDPHGKPVAPAALAALSNGSVLMKLRGLDQDEVHALVEGVFGKIQNTERLAAWLHRLTAGNPDRCLDLIRHLVENEFINFHSGVWALPMDLDDAALPSDLDAVLASRIARSTPQALRLVQALSVHRGPASFERVAAIAALEGIDEPLAAVEELEERGLLLSDERQVRFAHERGLDAVQRTLGESERKRLHAQLGRLLEGEGKNDPIARLDAGYHLLHGGEETRGADLLAAVGVELYADGEDMPLAVPALRAALDVYRKQKRGPRDLARVLGPLAISGFYTEYEVIETYGEQAEAVLADVTGLALARRMRPLLGHTLSAYLGLGSGLLRTAWALGPRRAYAAYLELVTLYSTVVTVLVGFGAMTLDATRTRRYARLPEPLTVLGRDHVGAFNVRLAQAIMLVPEDRHALALVRLDRLVERLDDPLPMRGETDGLRALMLSAVLYSLGAILASIADPRALVVADRLEGMGWQLQVMFANQIRAVYHGTRGEMALAIRYREQVELFAIQAGSSWQGEIWSTCSAGAWSKLIGDLLTMKRNAAQIESLARKVPSLRRNAVLARSACLILEGDVAAAYEIGNRVLAECEPRSYIGWSVTLAAHVHNVAALGDPARALELGTSGLARYDAADRLLAPFVVPLVIETALVEMQLRDHAAAATRIDGYLAEIGERGGPVTLGRLHEARALIALDSGDFASARLHASHVRRQFLPTENPALVARYEHLVQTMDGQDTGPAGGIRATLDLDEPLALRARRAMSDARTRSERYERALELLLEHSRAQRGRIFDCDDSILTLRAGAREGADAALEAASQELDAFTRHEERTQVTGSITEARSPSASQDRARTTCFLLSKKGDQGPRVVAVAAVEFAGRSLRVPPRSLLDALAEALVEPVAARATASFPPPPR
ncbi:MAG: protein kinase [Polyangiales bacterium]